MDIPTTEIFCNVPIFRFHTAGSGSIKMAKSVSTFAAEPSMEKVHARCRSLVYSCPKQIALADIEMLGPVRP